MYIKFEIHIFAPPPFLIHIFAPTEIYHKEGVRAAGEFFFYPFFNFFYFKSIGEKQKNIHPWNEIEAYTS